MNKINYNNSLNFNGKVIIKRASFFDRNKMCSFNVEHKTLNNLEITTKRTPNNKKIFVIKVKKNNITMAKETIEIKRKNKEMNGIFIRTSERYRKQSLGEILRLASIITMLENNIQKFKIFALDKAKGFHLKYKFKPEGEKFASGIDMVLTKDDILKNKHFYNELFKKHGIEYKI